MLWAGAACSARDAAMASNASPRRSSTSSQSKEIVGRDEAKSKASPVPEAPGLRRQSSDISVDNLLAPVARQPLPQSTQPVPDDAMDLDSPPRPHHSSYSASRPVLAPPELPSSRRQINSNGHLGVRDYAQNSARSVTNSQDSSLDSMIGDRVPRTPGDVSIGAMYRRPTSVEGKGKSRLAQGADKFRAEFNGTAGSGNQLQQSPASAAAQQNSFGNGRSASPNSRKRLADGQVKIRSRSHSPRKGHTRTASAASAASTSTSSISELSAELKTRLSYAMFKVSHGWESKTIDEVEALTSEMRSPSTSSSTTHRRHHSSTSPRLSGGIAQVRSAPHSAVNRRPSGSPPSTARASGALAPPAPIQPHATTKHVAGRGNPRRNSNPKYTPTMLSQSHSASPQTPAQVSRPDSRHSISRGEQDAAESLLFMSSPGHSTSLKHSFSPVPSPAISALLNPAPRPTGTRHALPDGPRKALPSHRPPIANKKAEAAKPCAMPLHLNPVDEDPIRHFHRTSDRGGPKRPVNDTVYRPRTLLPLPTGIPLGNGPRRKLQDADIERMLDRAMTREHESSDDEPIQIPKR